MIRDFYAELYARGDVTTPEMTPARAKMAQMPTAAEPLANNVGAAPGVLLQDEGTLIVSLPGVPAEMKDIFTYALSPRLDAAFHNRAYAERTVATDCWDESILAPAVDGVAQRHPGVYVKSRAQVYGSGVTDFITLAAHGPRARPKSPTSLTQPKPIRVRRWTRWGSGQGRPVLRVPPMDIELAAEVRRRLAALRCDYAFYCRPHDCEPVFLKNRDLFFSASLIKVPILFAWAYLEGSGRASRNEICELDLEPQVQGAGLSWLLQTRRLPFGDVLLLMIALSDNLCTNLVIQRIGIERLNAIFRGPLGLPDARLERKLFDYDARRGAWITMSPPRIASSSIGCATD